MTGIPKWIDELIWCGTPVKPDTIEYPKDPPGVLGPNTLRAMQRMIAPFRAEAHYRPAEILFSPSDWPSIRYELARQCELRLDEMAGVPAVMGLQLGEHAYLPPGFARLRYATGRIELVRLDRGDRPPIVEIENPARTPL